MSAASPAPVSQPFAEAFCRATTQVFTESFGATWTVEIIPVAETEAGAAAVWFGFSVSGDIKGEAALQFLLPDATLLAKKFVAQPESPATDFSVEDKQTVQALLERILAAVVRNLEYQPDKVQVQVGSVSPPAWTALKMGLHVAGELWGTSSLQLWISNDLVESMAPKPDPVPEPIAVAAPSPEAGTPPPADAPKASTPIVPPVDEGNEERELAIPTENRDLLWDIDLGVDLASISEKDFDSLRKVELDLVLRFGTKILPLQDVLTLRSGSVIELNHEVQQPADLLLGDKVVARGEVVIVDSNYGVRVTEVARPKARAKKTLRANA